MDFVIRKAEPKDVKCIQAIARKSWHATYEGIIPRQIQDNFLDAAYSDEMMKKRLEGSLVLVAESENEVVGFANFSPLQTEGRVHLGAIYLYPDFQGRGIGTGLLEHGVGNIDGVREIHVDVEKENTAGRAFYETRGFKKVKEFDEDFDGHMMKTVQMVLEI